MRVIFQMWERRINAWYQVHPDSITLLRKRVQDEFLATSTEEYKVTKSSSHALLRSPPGNDKSRRKNYLENIRSG